MARIVMGIGTSHTPMLTLESDDWVHRAADDLRNAKLNQSDGTWISYDELLANVGSRYEDRVTPAALREAADTCQRALDRLKADLERIAPDVVIIVGDDQAELFGPENLPVISMFYGDEIVTHDRWGDAKYPAWAKSMGRGYAMDAVHSFPGAREFALELIKGMVARNIDVATSSKIVDPHKAGFGHAFGFIVKRLMGDRPIPVIPILINTYYPPNVPSAARCHDIGRALRDAIEESPTDLRVAVVASGGLSHFIVDEELDRRVIAGFAPENAHLLRELPDGALMSGSSEILNWIVTAGAVDRLPLDWIDYVPLYRTPAGTGVGAAFAVWASGE
ncbi:MAG: extradiol ring-cleavage dioxygenase [Sphingomonas bacterium]|nr:extradiol ring-cleavage dioxygenase [Sphingomonas bacterium]